MSNSKPPKSPSFRSQYEESDIPAYLHAPLRAIGAGIAAGKLGSSSAPIHAAAPRTSPEDLAKLVDRLQETFGAKGARRSGSESGQQAPPPTPLEKGGDVWVKEKPRGSKEYQAYMEEVEDEYWAKKP